MDNKDKIIGFRCDDSTRQSLEKIAADTGMSLSAVVRRAVRMLQGDKSDPEPTPAPPAEAVEPAATEPEIDITAVILKG